jgi:hypothetical protein
MKLKRRVPKSPGYAKMNDETTDNTNNKHLAFCVKYIDMDSSSSCVDYVKDVRINYGKAETIFNETRTVINDLNNNKFVAFASDGCNTMIGKKTGVSSTRLKEIKPEIIIVHCHNHCLALAAKYSFDSIKMMHDDTDDQFTHVFKYYKASGNRTGYVERIQKMLEVGGQKKKVKQAAHT